MGAYGSGRWGWHHAKATTDRQLRLDVRYLARQGLIASGGVGSLLVAWTCGEQPAGTILVHYDADRADEVVLAYNVGRGEGEAWVPVRERVALDRTLGRYGGSRLWFRCPGCRARRAVLYGADGRFRCRVCHSLAYSSTREGAIERHRRRADALRRRLGGRPGAFAAVWKPKGMHWRTYDRIVTEIRAREVAALVAVSAETDAMLARLSCNGGSLPVT